MNRLLNNLIGTKTDEEISDESDEEIGTDVPDGVPPEWSGLTPDPAPAGRRSADPLVPKTYGKVTPALKKRIAAEIQAYVEFAAMPVIMRDPVCGGAVHEQAKPIADSIATILARYPEIAHKFLATGVLGDWLKFGLAMQPVLAAVWSHHIAGSPEQHAGGDDDFDPATLEPYRPGL